jgi:hypothetical protein
MGKSRFITLVIYLKNNSKAVHTEVGQTRKGPPQQHKKLTTKRRKQASSQQEVGHKENALSPAFSLSGRGPAVRPAIQRPAPHLPGAPTGHPGQRADPNPPKKNPHPRTSPSAAPRHRAPHRRRIAHTNRRIALLNTRHADVEVTDACKHHRFPDPNIAVVTSHR